MDKSFSDLIWLFLESQVQKAEDALQNISFLPFPLSKPIKGVQEKIMRLREDIEKIKEAYYPKLPQDFESDFKEIESLVSHKGYELDPVYIQALNKNKAALSLKSFQNEYHLHRLQDRLCHLNILSRSNDSDRYLFCLKLKKALKGYGHEKKTR